LRARRRALTHKTPEIIARSAIKKSQIAVAERAKARAQVWQPRASGPPLLSDHHQLQWEERAAIAITELPIQALPRPALPQVRIACNLHDAHHDKSREESRLVTSGHDVGESWGSRIRT
jgi:hypothetical protein